MSRSLRIEYVKPAGLGNRPLIFDPGTGDITFFHVDSKERVIVRIMLNGQQFITRCIADVYGFGMLFLKRFHYFFLLYLI